MRRRKLGILQVSLELHFLLQNPISDTSTLSVSTFWMTHHAVYHPRCTKGISETRRTHTQTSKEVCAGFLLQTVTPAPSLSSLPWETDAKLSPIWLKGTHTSGAGVNTHRPQAKYVEGSFTGPPQLPYFHWAKQRDSQSSAYRMQPGDLIKARDFLHLFREG